MKPVCARAASQYGGVDRLSSACVSVVANQWFDRPLDHRIDELAPVVGGRRPGLHEFRATPVLVGLGRPGRPDAVELDGDPGGRHLDVEVRRHLVLILEGEPQAPVADVEDPRR